MKRFVFRLIDRMLCWICFLLGKIPKKKLREEDFHKILLIKLSAMGDALALMATIKAIKSTYPNSHITWLTTYRVNLELFNNLTFIDELVELIPIHKSTTRFFLNLLFHPYDLSIDFDQYYQLSEIISFFGSRGRSVGFRTKIKGKSTARAIDYDPLTNEKIMFYNLAQVAVSKDLNELNPVLPEILTDYSPSQEIIKFLNEHTGRLILIYPGSSSNAAFRRWPLHCYLELARIIHIKLQGNVIVVFVGGPDEIFFKSIIREAGYIEIINRYSLRDMFYLFTKATLLIGNDGGLLHLAEAAGLHVVGIFGPSLSAKWGSINSYSRAVEVDLPCRPCLRNWQGKVPQSCFLGTVDCLMQISTDKLFLEVKDVLSSLQQ